MSILAAAPAAASRIARSQPAPLRVAIAENCEVVVHGLWSMLFPYAHRVALVASDRTARTHHDPHLVLHETQCHDGRPATVDDELQQDLRAGRAVVYTWNVDAATSAWTGPLPAGFLSKTLPAEHLVDSLERIRAGHHVVARPTSSSAPQEWPGQQAGLGRQQSQVLALITSGVSNQEIARRLHISINTVKSHVRATYQRIGVETRSQAMLWALDRGFREAAAGHALRAVPAPRSGQVDGR